MPRSPVTDAERAGREVTYGELGRNLFRLVLHPERVEESLAVVLGDTIDIGPFGAGPGRRMAKIKVLGTIGRPRAEALPGDLVAYRVTLPVDAVFALHAAGDVHRFKATVRIPLLMTARAVEPLTIWWDITPPGERDLDIHLEVDRRRTAVLRRVAGIDAELRSFLVRYVQRELAKEHVRRATSLDLGAVIDAAWPMITERFLAPPGPGSDVSAEAAAMPRQVGSEHHDDSREEHA